MILNTGSRTDTVQYYTKWLLKRFEEGFVYSRNPMFQNKVTRYELNPEVLDCVIFCSKNYEPILDDITKITDRFNTYFHYTITAYGKDIEPNVPNIDKSIETLIKLSQIVGKQRIAWRYDPILLTNKYTKELHYKTFDYMAEKLSPYIDRCIFSFVEMYKKLQTNMPEIILLTQSDKEKIAKAYIQQSQSVPIEEQCENYKAAYASIEKDCKITAKVSKIANTKMDKAILKNKDMKAFGHNDLSLFIENEKSEEEPLYLFETDKILAQEAASINA